MTTSPAAPGSLPAALRFDGAGGALLILAALAPLPLFWFGFEGLLSAWMTPEYSHGPLIPLLSGFMFLREMARVPAVDRPVTDRWPGLALAAFAIALAVLGNVTRIADIVFYSIVLYVGALVLICFGWKRGRGFWPAVLHLVFMIPLPQFLYWQVNIHLQFISSEIGVALVRAAGVPVFLDGNVIDLGVYKLLVAEACSGLRYLFPIMSFSYIFCVLYQGARWHKAVLLLAAVPMAVLMNSFRIGMIGVLVNYYGISHAEGFLHYFEGWVIFGACIALLFLLALAMQRLSGDRRPLSEALDLEFDEIVPQLRRISTVVPSAALLGATLIAGGAGAAWTAAPEAAPVTIERRAFAAFPLALEDWRGAPLPPLDEGVARVLAADDYFSADYRTPGTGSTVNLWVAWYAKQTEGQAVHSPEACLPAGGWEMFDIRERTVQAPGPDGAMQTFDVNRAIIQKGDSKQVVWYWVQGRGRKLTSEIASKVWAVYDSARIGRTDGALVRLITPLARGEDPSAGDERLAAFLQVLEPRLPEFVPD